MPQKTTSPAVIGEYLSFNHCERYFKHRANGIEETKNHNKSEFAEAFNPLGILLSKTGEDFEQEIYENVKRGVDEVIDLNTGDDSVDADHSRLIDLIGEIQDRPKSDRPTLITEMLQSISWPTILKG
jgi:hypothetical protein